MEVNVREKALRIEVHKWKIRKCQFMKQYSRVKNVTLKDHNTKFFHTLANLQHKKKLISKIHISNQVLRGKESIQQGVMEYLSNISLKGNF